MRKADTKKLGEYFRRARNAGAPIIGVETADQYATVKNLIGVLEQMDKDAKRTESPILTWDSVRGLIAENKPAAAWVQAITRPVPAKAAVGGGLPTPGAPPFNMAKTIDLTTTLDLLLSGTPSGPALPAESVVFALNAHRTLEHHEKSTNPIQGVLNLRDPFKDDGRAFVPMAPAWRLPIELTNDMLVFSEALPDEAAVREIIKNVYESAGLSKLLDEKTLAAVADATIGLSAFAVEQVVALCLTKTGIDLDDVWERKRTIIEQTDGLSVWRGDEALGELLDVEGASDFVTELSKHWNPRVVMFIDEVEKAIAGYRGDTSGVSQDQMGQLLSWTEDREVVGLLLMGPPGTGKSGFAKAAGNFCKAPTVKFDLGAMQGSLIGSSQRKLRHGLSVVDAVGQGRILMIATCNGLEALPPEFRRRFKYGLYYFDLPTELGKAAIWMNNLKRYGLAKQTLPADHNWTGAEIKACCEISSRTKLPLVQAARKVVSIYKSNPGLVEGLRKQAVESGFIDARTGDAFEMPKGANQSVALPTPVFGRRVRIDDMPDKES